MTHDPQRFNINYTFTQPYNTSWNPYYNNLATVQELARIDAVDNIVQNMLTYPDAERIINKLKANGA